MSGKTKRILYRVAYIVTALCAVAATAVLLVFAVRTGGPLSTESTAVWIAVGVAIAVAVLFPLNLIVHELGHVLFGVLVGLRPVSVKIGYFCVSRNGVRFSLDTDAGGMSAMLARNVAHLRGKLFFAALGGAACNLIYGAVCLTLWFLFPSPATLFFVLLAPVNLFEGIAALLPLERTDGATDGAVLIGLMKKRPFAEVMLGILKTQSVLVKGTYANVKREWLFGVPVIREDDVLFLALTQLRWQYLFCRNDEKGAFGQLKRLERLYEYHSDPDVACDLAYANAVFFSDSERAAAFLDAASAAKGTLSYAVASAACGSGEMEFAREQAEKERWTGSQKLALRLIERIPHVI